MNARFHQSPPSSRFLTGFSRFRLAGIALLFVTSLAWGSPPWIPAADMASARVFATATLLRDGRVLVAGGQNGDGILATSEFYDPALNVWQVGPSIFVGRTGHTATLLTDGRVLIAGGLTALSPPPSAMTGLLYDPADGEWHTTPGSMVIRAAHTATLLDSGKVLVAGGWNGDPMADAKLFDPSNGTFSDAGSMSTPRYDHVAAKLPDGRVLVAGGGTGSGGMAPTATVEIYDPASNSWTQAADLAFARRLPAVVVMSSGKAMVIGGVAGNVPVAATEIYDAASNSWSSSGSLSSGRGYLSATLLPGGSVLASGGSGSTGPSDQSDLYRPATGQWTYAGSMLETRSQHVALLLPDGQVLVLGGVGTSYLSSAERYEWNSIFADDFD